MKRLTILGIIACVGLVFAPAAVLADPSGPPGGLDVKVVNQEPIPVAGDIAATVTGDVSVVNQPTVNAQQSGTWSMSIDNTTTNPVPVVEERSVNPIVRQKSEDDECDSNCRAEVYQVPAGNRRFVIEYVYVNVVVDEWNYEQPIPVTVNIDDKYYYAVGLMERIFNVAGTEDPQFELAKQVKLYAAPGETVYVSATTYLLDRLDSMRVNISGYLEPAAP
jgi:hypothetical protein